MDSNLEEEIARLSAPQRAEDAEPIPRTGGYYTYTQDQGVALPLGQEQQRNVGGEGRVEQHRISRRGSGYGSGDLSRQGSARSLSSSGRGSPRAAGNQNGRKIFIGMSTCLIVGAAVSYACCCGYLYK